MIIDRDGLRAALRAAPLDFAFENLHLARDDTRYFVPALSDLETEIANGRQWIESNDFVYRLGEFDCNAFAWLMKSVIIAQAWNDHMMRPPWPFGYAKGLAASIVGGGQEWQGHAFNIAYVRNGSDLPVWVWIEPQPGGTIAAASACPYRNLWSIEF